MKWELAGGLFPSGKVEFNENDIQAVGPKYEALWVRLKSGNIYYLSRQYEQTFRRMGFY